MQKYTVDKFIIVAPSIHNFNGSKASAEVLINHTPDGGGESIYSLHSNYRIY